MFDPKQPLWMPQGSVRALLALIVVIGTVALIVALALSGVLDAKEAALMLIGLATLVLNAYFLTRKDTSRGA